MGVRLDGVRAVRLGWPLIGAIVEPLHATLLLGSAFPTPPTAGHGTWSPAYGPPCMYAGPVSRLRVLGDTQHQTKIAFIEFMNAASAEAALKCSGALLGSLPVRVSPSKTPVRSEPAHRHGGAAQQQHQQVQLLQQAQQQLAAVPQHFYLPGL